MKPPFDERYIPPALFLKMKECRHRDECRLPDGLHCHQKTHAECRRKGMGAEDWWRASALLRGVRRA